MTVANTAPTEREPMWWDRLKLLLERAALAIFGTPSDDDGREERGFQQMIAGGPAAPSPAPLPLWQRVRDQVAGLQKIDPQFSPEAVGARAQTLLDAEFRAEHAMDASGLTDLATPDFVTAFQARVDQWRAAGMRRIVDKATFDSGVLFKVAVDGDAQRVVVRVTGSAVRWIEDAVLGGLSDGSREPQSFTEFVTLRRPAGVVTAAPSTRAAICPSCGAPVTAGASSCAYCGGPLNGAVAADWLLDHLSASAYT